MEMELKLVFVHPQLYYVYVFSCRLNVAHFSPSSFSLCSFASSILRLVIALYANNSSVLFVENEW